MTAQVKQAASSKRWPGLLRVQYRHAGSDISTALYSVGPTVSLTLFLKTATPPLYGDFYVVIYSKIFKKVELFLFD
jgi:hypothetical protein